MACRTVWVVAAACALLGTAAGCRRSPLGNQRDGAAGGTSGTPSRGDSASEWPEAGLDTAVDSPREIAPPGGDAVDPAPDAGEARDAGREAIGDARDDAPVDAPADLAADVPLEAPVDAPADAPADAPEETGGADAPTDGSPLDVADGGGSDVRPEDQPCGPSGWRCNPFACDVALGVCKTACATDDDCYARRACTQHTCGLGNYACTANEECNSGFCAQGVCCQTACSGTCRSCAVPGSIGTCALVPIGTPDPIGSCASGDVCDGRGQCVPGTCTVAADCGRFHACTGGRCVPCNATCASTPDCTAPAICIDNNGCTICGLPDAGTP
jgi:hypothetical protein